MADYADWTESMELLGTEIMLPIDLQGSVIMVPMDFQGQTVNLQVDIVAQTIEAIAIDISAQSIGNLTIDVSAQSVGVYLQETWVAKEGTDKNFVGFAQNQVHAASASAEYEVPTGKTLFITNVTGACSANAAADADKDQMCFAQIQKNASVLATMGGNGGAGITFSKPYRFAAGDTLTVLCANEANHNCDLRVSANGWEE